MTEEEFVKHLKEEILSDAFNYYFETLPTPIKGIDRYWEKSKQLFHSLNDEQRNQLKVFTQLIMIDTIYSNWTIYLPTLIKKVLLKLHSMEML